MYEAAEKMYQQVLELKKKVLGPTSMSNLALTLMYQEVLELKKTVLGPKTLGSMAVRASIRWLRRCVSRWWS